MEHDWTFEAHDRRTGRAIAINRRWQNWGPATDPLHNEGGEWKGRFERAEDCDERLYLDPGGPYVLAWRIDESTSYYASDYRYYCDCMTDAEAAAWFAKQSIPPHKRQAATTEHRTLWELGLRIAPALDALYSAIGELFDDDYECTFLGIGGDGERKVRAAAVELHARMPLENDPFREWELFGAPRGTQDFVDIVSSIDAFTKRLVNDLAYRDTDGCYWSEALKKTHGCRDFLRENIVKLESLPELRPYVLAEALRKLQEPAPATGEADGAAIGVQAVSPSVVQSIERRIEPDGTVSGTPTALRTFGALDAGAVKATSTAAVESPVAQPVAVNVNELNIRARAFLLLNPDAGCRPLAEHLGCSTGTVRKLSAYIAVKERRQQANPPAPKAVPFDERMAESIGTRDAELDRLMAEQTADDRADNATRKMYGKPVGRRQTP